MTKKLLLISISILLTLLSACGGGGECGITPTTAAADQSIVGTANNDVLNSTQGNDTIDGLGGLNTVVYQCSRSNYTIAKTTNGWTVTSAAEGTDTLANIQRLQFTDQIVALDVDGNAGMAYRIYQAAFNRTPDNEGLKFWIAQLDNGASYQSVAAGFISSAEFQSLYGKNPSNGDFITKLYSNVLHRAPDPAGYAWWLNVLNTNQITQVGALMGFSESAENKSGVSAAIATGVSLSPLVLTPIQVLASSYENQIKSGNELGPQAIPFEWKPCGDRASCGELPTPAASFADFLRNGSYQLIQHSVEYNAINSLDKERKGRIKFYEFNDGKWIEKTEKIFPNGGNDGCLQASKAVVADFLKNGRPSVFFPCFGFDGEGGIGEHQRILLANSDGTFTNKLLTNIPIIAAAYASAADINSDGYPDIVITGSYLSNALIFLINDKNGGFYLDKTRFPASLSNQPYFSVELVKNKSNEIYDLLLGGIENCCGLLYSPGRLFLNDGTGNYLSTNYIQIPSYKNYGMIIDFLYDGENIYVSKVPDNKDEYYESYIIQKFNISTKNSIVIYENLNGWVNPLGQSPENKLKFIYNLIFHQGKIKAQNSIFNLSVDTN